MERLRFKAYVVPQTPGSMQEITSSTISFHTVRKENEERLNEDIVDRINKGDSGIEGITVNHLKELLEHRRKLYAFPLPPNFREQMSQKEKRQIFIPATRAMESFANLHGITLPNNLIQRIIILDQNTASYVHQANNSEHDDLDYPAFTLHDKRLCFISNDYVADISAEEGISKQDLIREIGIHELWHSIAYYEVWTTQDKDNNSPKLNDINSWRRNGMDTRRPEGRPINQIQYSALVEGFTQYVTRETLKLLGTTRVRYLEGQEIIEMLIGQIGLDPFVQATFTKKGFKVLFDAIEKRYGKGAFRKIGSTLAEDFIEDLLGQFTSDTHVFFRKTKAFLQEN